MRDELAPKWLRSRAGRSAWASRQVAWSDVGESDGVREEAKVLNVSGVEEADWQGNV